MIHGLSKAFPTLMRLSQKLYFWEFIVGPYIIVNCYERKGVQEYKKVDNIATSNNDLNVNLSFPSKN